MPFTTDPNHPDLGHGADKDPIPQHKVYLILSEDERAKGFVRPVRTCYVHVGAPGPKYPLTDLTEQDHERYIEYGYVKYEAYPEGSNNSGRFWTREQLDNVGKGCGTSTTMSRELGETYARKPDFYGSTYCLHCSKHLPVNEFIWFGTNEIVGS